MTTLIEDAKLVTEARFNKGLDDADDSEWGPVPVPVMRAARRLAADYLRRQDAGTVDREWLESIGFNSECGRFSLGRLQFTFYNGWNAWWSFSDGRGATRLIDDVKSRGAVLRLLEALGVEVPPGCTA